MKKRLDASFFIFTLAIAFSIFLLGGIFASKQWQPYQLFEDGYKSALELIKQLKQTRPGAMEKIKYPGSGVTKYNKGAAYNGITLIQGWFPKGTGIHLIDMKGKLLHQWNMDFFKIWPKPEHVTPKANIPVTRYNYHTQGMWLYPDGSVLVNFSELGTARIDSCGDTVWTLNRMNHHAITMNPDGSFWTLSKRDINKISEDVLLYNVSLDDLQSESSNLYEDILLLVSNDGQVLKEISVLKSLIDGDFEQKLYDVSLISKLDPTHVNDIEVVNNALAKKIPDVNPGDLLISIRQMHMLAILDKNTGKIKWHYSDAPWIRQHDIDITDKGTIEIFNNDYKEMKLKDIPGSSIISYDPEDNSHYTIYPRQKEDAFYTKIMGTHQTLGNGNRLITETMAGRVFEIDPEGNTVWEYLSPYDKGYSSILDSAIRYKTDYAEPEHWKCHN